MQLSACRSEQEPHPALQKQAIESSSCTRLKEFSPELTHWFRLL